MELLADLVKDVVFIDMSSMGGLTTLLDLSITTLALSTSLILFLVSSMAPMSVNSMSSLFWPGAIIVHMHLQHSKFEKTSALVFSIFAPRLRYSHFLIFGRVPCWHGREKMKNGLISAPKQKLEKLKAIYFLRLSKIKKSKCPLFFQFLIHSGVGTPIGPQSSSLHF